MSNSSTFGSISDYNKVSALDELCLWAAPFGQMILDSVNYISGITFLDIGCGTGFPLLELAQRIDSSKAFAVDPWNEGCDRAEQKMRCMGLENIKIIRSQAEEMPFEDNFFELIVSNNGINNVFDIDQVFKECKRVLKPGGQFIFTMNLPETMIEFYTILKSVLESNGLCELIEKVDEHIYKKRMPKDVVIRKLDIYGLKNIRYTENSFYLRYSNGNALFNHFFMKLTFIKGWKEVIPEELHGKIFDDVVSGLNELAKKQKGLRLTIPMLCVECTK